MSERPVSPVLDPQGVAPLTGSSYPQAFRDPVAGRVKRVLGDPLGITHYGVNLVELAPGAWSSQRHWHSEEDEFVFVLAGQVTVVSDAGRRVLVAGMAAGFPAGRADGHHLVNESDAPATFLEVGDRSDADAVDYPDIDMVLTSPVDGRRFLHRDGRPYED